MLRVVMVSKAFHRRAYRHQLAQLAALPEIAEFTLVASPGWTDEGQRYPFENGADPSFDVRVEPIVFNGNFHLYFWPTLARILQEKRPDLVHIDEEPYNLAAFLCAWQARRFGARAVFFTWQNIFKRYAPPFSLFEKYVYASCASAIAGNHEAKDILRRKGYRGMISVIPQVGVDPTLFSPGQRPEHAVPTIGFAARLVEQKGLLVLLDAFGALAPPCRLHVIGSGPLEPIARDRAARLGVLDRITWESQVLSADMPSRLRTFDVLVLPSLTTGQWKEQFGRVLIEAMACGVPVIGSNSGEIPHVLDGVGPIVPEGDPAALAQAIASLLANPSRLEHTALAGRERVLQLYTQQRIAKQTAQVYSQALATAGR